MNTVPHTRSLPHLELPEGSPRVRITAGVGSAAQKTWSLRRPVTLIGSRRPAHIVLHDRNISKAHCVIVNTGTDVLLKDLHTSGGTVRNKKKEDLCVLEDGDVITVGSTTIQIAIQMGEQLSESCAGHTYKDPTMLPEPLYLSLSHTDRDWKVVEAVTLIGRHKAAPIWLDHEQVAQRQAIFFRFDEDVALYDLGGTGVFVSGQHCSCSKLTPGNHINLGPFGLDIVTLNGESKVAQGAPASTVEDATTTPLDVAAVDSEHERVDELADIKKRIATSWEQLNSWKSEPEDTGDASPDVTVPPAMDRDEAESRDAAMRGQLHDIEQLHEDLLNRHRVFHDQSVELREGRTRVAQLEQQIKQQSDELAQRAKEIARREHVVAQRWSRLQAAKCQHCDQPYKLSD